MAAVLVAVFLVVPCAAFGTCSTVVGIEGMQHGGDTAVYSFFGLVVGVVSLILFVGLVFGVRSLWRG